MNHCRAQASYELVLLIAFVVALSALIAGYFISDAQSSQVEAKAKAALLEGLNSEENAYFLQSVELKAGRLEVCFNPSLPEGCTALRQKVSAATGIQPTDVLFGFVEEYGFCGAFAPDCPAPAP